MLFIYIIIQMEKAQTENQKMPLKVNYQDKNLDYIQKIKQKKLREEQEKLQQSRKQQLKRQRLKQKILHEARNRQNRENKDEYEPNFESQQSTTPVSKPQSTKNIGDRRKNFDSLPKIHSSSKQIDDAGKVNYRDRYISFLKNLHHTVKQKKQTQQLHKKRKQQQYARIKEGLGYDNVESKLITKISKPNTEQMGRSHSAQKISIQLQMAESEMPKTNKNFKKKNEQYIQKLKQKRQLESQVKQQQKKRQQRLKSKLKDFVMVTVKQNVLDGVYDEVEETQKKQKNKNDNSQSDGQEDEQEEEQMPSEDKKKRRKMRSFPYVTDIVQWKKKNRIEPDDKVFIVTGGYGDIKKALRQRGWFQNPDSHSPCFDFKYTLQGREIQYDKIQENQLVNHFQKAGCLTTKVGLTKSLRNLKWIKDVSEDNFYPKCFDLNDEDDSFGFQIHFKICKALSILKIYMSFVEQAKKSPQTRKKNRNLIQDLKLRTQVAVIVCKKNIQDIDDIIDRKKTIKVVTDKQWQILAQDELNEEGLAKKKHQQWLKSIDCKFNSKDKSGKPEKKPKKKKQKQNINADQTDPNRNEEQQDENQQQNQLMEEVSTILQEYEKRFPQFQLTGHNNIWILKPAGLSRGRGIICYNNLVEIQDHVKCKQSQWIAQKYIENPLVVLKRKFDIRLWILITNFNPLTIWYYDQSYIRFSAVDYDAKQISNKFIHLTNNAIGSQYKQFQDSHIKGNMFFQQQFADYLQQLQGYDVFTQKIKPQLKQIVKYSMMCGVEGVQNRKKTHELFGYDFMVDQTYKVWLIQINSSPSMDYSTHVTAKLVKQCLHDVIKVAIDYSSAPKKEKKNIDTGNFKKIYKGVQIPDKPISTGLNLCLEGIPLKKPKRNTVKITNFSLDKRNK